MKYYLFSLIFIIVTGCSFQPNNADGIILQKVSTDTLALSIIDSYYIIKKYEIQNNKDTLLITVKSIYSPDNLSINKQVFIRVGININYVKLQNDKIYNIDSIPKYPY